MPAWVQIVLWWLAFAATHMALSSNRLRPRLRSSLGAGGFLALYSALAFATFVPLVVVYFASLATAEPLGGGQARAALAWGAWALSWAGWTLAIAALLQPSPVSFGATASGAVRGMTRITRHGLFVGLILWALAHLVLNPTAEGVAFFGGFAVYTVLGILHQDARKRASEPGLAALYRESSVIPFAAILAGRTRLTPSELPWPRLALACALAYGLYAIHPWMFRG